MLLAGLENASTLAHVLLADNSAVQSHSAGAHIDPCLTPLWRAVLDDVQGAIWVLCFVILVDPMSLGSFAALYVPSPLGTRFITSTLSHMDCGDKARISGGALGSKM